LKLKYPIRGIHPTQCLSIDSITKQLEFNINTDYLEFETNTKRTLKPKLELKGVKWNNGLSIDSVTKLLEFKYDTSNLTLDVNNKFKINIGYSLMAGANGIDVKLEDTSLSLSSLGLKLNIGNTLLNCLMVLMLNWQIQVYPHQ